MPDRSLADREDARRFLERLRTEAGKGAHAAIRPGERTTVARAPGRLDLMGGIADYSGSLVLQWPIAEATFAAVQEGEPGMLEVATAREDGGLDRARFARDAFAARTGVGYDAIRSDFGRDPGTRWAAYALGPLAVLHREKGVDVPAGLRMFIASDVPTAKGVSSSAALEVAAMRALAGHLGVTLDDIELATLCQMAENHVVGAPCGIMDQMASALGREGQLLALLCQPAEVKGFERLPDGLAIWGIDSGIRHAVSGSDYGAVRVGAAMGYRMLTDDENPGLTRRLHERDAMIRSGKKIDASTLEPIAYRDTRWRGYLANITPEAFDEGPGASLPESITGREFLDRYAEVVDTVVTVDPGRAYAVRQPTAHPIREHARVRRFAEVLQAGADSEPERRELGDLMFASHASYSACGLGSDGTDRLVEMVRAAGPEAGVYGAKITGGGSGGTVAVLGRSDAGEAVAAIARRYAEETGHPPFVFAGSSPGACELDPITIEI
jgi:L-arabinokinase